MQSALSTNLRKVFIFNFLVSFTMFSGVLIPFFTMWGKISLSQTLLLQTWFVIWAFLLEVPTGVVADYIGRKYSLFIGALIGSIATLVYSSIPAWPIFLLGEFLFAVSMALFSGADHAFVYDTLKEEKREAETKKIIGRYESAGLIAMMIAAPIGGLIGGMYGPQMAMRATAIPMFLAFLIGLTLREPNIKRERETTRMLEIVQNGWNVIIHEKKLQRIALDLALVQSLSFLMIWLYQPLVLRLGVSISWLGFIHAGIAGGQVLIMQWYPKLEKKVSVPKLLLTTGIGIGILFFAAGFLTFIPLLILSIILVTGFGLTRQVLVSQELNELIPSDQRATVLSFVAVLRRLCRASLSPLVGPLADRSLPLATAAIGISIVTAVLSLSKSSTTNQKHVKDIRI